LSPSRWNALKPGFHRARTRWNRAFISLAPRLPERTESPVSPRWNALEPGVHRAGGKAAGEAGGKAAGAAGGEAAGEAGGEVAGWGRASGPAVLVPQMRIPGTGFVRFCEF
jgi:hypothetical protein